MSKRDEMFDIRNVHKIDYMGYHVVSYEDDMLGKWIGNVEVYDPDGRMVSHATTADGAWDEQRLREYAEKEVRSLVILRNTEKYVSKDGENDDLH